MKKIRLDSDNKVLNTTLGKENHEVIIGDEISLTNSFPKVKFYKWNREAFLSLRSDDFIGNLILEEGNAKLESFGKLDFYFKHDKDYEDRLKFGLILKEKPDTNKFIFKLEGWQDFVFLYQKPLKYKNPDGSTYEGKKHRPADVNDSYAVYHKTKKDNHYKTGKFGHFYNPEFIDADGKRARGKLHIENGFYELTAPQEFLDSAKYPIIVNDTFGTTDIGGSDNYAEDGQTMAAKLSELSPAGSNTLTNISWYGSPSGTIDMQFGLYSHNSVDDEPDTRLCYDATPFTVTNAEQWHTNSVSYNYALSANTQYWVAFSPESSEDFTFYYDSNDEKYIFDYNNTFPESWSRDDESETSVVISVYATYTVSGSPSASPSVSPSASPSISVSASPSTSPSVSPSISPSSSPSPSSSQSASPSISPSVSISISPSVSESVSQSVSPSISESASPSVSESASPSVSESESPSISPSISESLSPSISPSISPSVSESVSPSVSPSQSQSISPSISPSVSESTSPSVSPSASPSESPSVSTSVSESASPSVSQSVSPSVSPSASPSASPSTNIPTIDEEKISLGQCIIYVGSVGSTPTTDIGIIDDTTLTINTDFMKVDSSDPNVAKVKYPISNTARIEGTFYQLDGNRFKEIVGSADGSSLLFSYGGYKTADKKSMLLYHETPEDSGLVRDIIQIKLWKVIGSGNLDIPFNKSLNSYPITMDLLAANTDWTGADLTNLGKLFKIYTTAIIYIVDNSGNYVINNAGQYVIKT